jgi:hypothetical protein
MAYKYEEIIDANDPKWLAELKSFIDKGKQVAVVHLNPDQVGDCIAYAQEHDFTCAVEDKTFNPKTFEWGERPMTLGLVHRDRKKRIRYPKSR